MFRKPITTSVKAVMSIHRAAPVLVLAAALLIGFAMGPAEAATKVFHDQAGDVSSGIDVTRVRVDNAKRLVLTAQHHSLTRHATQSVGYFLDTDRLRPGPEFVVVGGFPGSDWNVFKARGWQAVGWPSTCPVNMVISYPGDFTRFALARSCLKGNRGRVRVSLFATRKNADGTTAREYMPGHHRFSPWVSYGASAASDRYLEFRSPSGNILCSIVNHVAENYNVNRCDISRKTFKSPARPRSCPQPYGWGRYFWLDKIGRFTCVSELATSERPPVLRYGTSKRLGHIECTSRRTGMVCLNVNTGHGYKLTQGAVTFF
jgi:Family of unknown function (DUF6636)